MLKIPYEYPELQSINTNNLTQYLLKNNWKMVQKYPQYIFEGPKDDNNTQIQIIIPRGKDEKDIQNRITETINLLGIIENRSPYNIIKSIKTKETPPTKCTECKYYERKRICIDFVREACTHPDNPCDEPGRSYQLRGWPSAYMGGKPPLFPPKWCPLQQK